MSRPLEGKLAIVTGASRGIGKAIAESLATRGANLILAYTSPSSTSVTESLATHLSKTHNIKAIPIQSDLSTPSGPADLITRSLPHFTPFRIDILINNAGIALNDPLPSINVDDFSKSYNTNVRGPLLLAQASLPYLPTDRTGRIISISSVSSTLGFEGQSIYGGTKAALESMSRTWSRELSHSCTVNCINPGPVAGEMYDANSDEFKRKIKPFIQNAPLMEVREGVDDPQEVEKAKLTGGRAASVEEIAGVVVLLCMKEAGWITGQVVSANGGMVFGLS
ncbi:hypothetical protein HK097_010313 [Rhizophlyctis rosea]|uniref:Ketoreductase domain-containing protein n=1 Tax=Rhizophlyctis rosea TaxID=64517 RepID=A0AAD5SAE8_9FUNG|nr:hypothetical protein HK097_010313 [Rhizophlyctis rosea]